MNVRIVTWNIHKGIGGLDRRYRLERVIEVLRSYAPDVALLQEVAEDLPRSLFHSQVELLAEAMHLPHRIYHPQHHFRLGRYGNAILSRWPLYDVHQLDLTIAGRKRRGALQAHTKVTLDGHTRTLVLHSLHLGLAGTERALQLQTFLASHPFRGLHQHTPVVLGGDLNDLWGTLGPRFLAPAGFTRAGPLLNTFPAWMPVRPLDALFVRGDIQLHTFHRCRRKPCRSASDHLPLVADFNLPPASLPSSAPSPAWQN